jgi:hypothetical protein
MTDQKIEIEIKMQEISPGVWRGFSDDYPDRQFLIVEEDKKEPPRVDTESVCRSCGDAL